MARKGRKSGKGGHAVVDRREARNMQARTSKLKRTERKTSDRSANNAPKPKTAQQIRRVVSRPGSRVRKNHRNHGMKAR